MRLDDLLRGVARVPEGLGDVVAFGVADDSRNVTTGDVFVCRRGGEAFAADARRRGAVAVLTPDMLAAGVDVDAVAGMLAHRLHGDPTRHGLDVLAVTGTNGKTTVAYLVRHITATLGVRCGLVGTCVVDDGLRERDANLTTPGSVELASLFARMRDNGCRAAAMEASSHALDQGRLAGVRVAGAAFTNLTGDHLDYHGTMDAYADAKARLFAPLTLDAAGVAVVNARDPWAARMTRDTTARVVRAGVGTGDAVDWHAADLRASAAGTRFRLDTPAGPVDVDLPMVGRHNVENAVVAAALASETLGLAAGDVAGALATACGAPGRLERVEANGVDVFVDYAHTDDALSNVLTALRPVTRGRLVVVFGCGGDRDRTKRPRMARVAASLADRVIVTSDNPRTEDPHAILADVAAGFGPGDTYKIEADRRTAIRVALASARPGDVVLVAGKGHETYQIVGDRRLVFDDRAEVRRALAAVATPAKGAA